MTFASEEIRFTFHTLPTERQVEFVETEERLAKLGLYVVIENVLLDGRHLEVLVRVSSEYEASARARIDRTDG